MGWGGEIPLRPVPVAKLYGTYPRMNHAAPTERKTQGKSDAGNWGSICYLTIYRKSVFYKSYAFAQGKDSGVAEKSKFIILRFQ